MSRSIGYTRLSQESDTSIDRQKRHIHEYVVDLGFELETIYDDGERSSGFDESREEYVKLRGRVQSGEIEAVVVNDKRRLARDFDETMRLVLDLREHDVEAHTYQQGQLDLSDPVQAPSRSSRLRANTKRKRRRSNGLVKQSKNDSTMGSIMDVHQLDSDLTMPVNDGSPTLEGNSKT